MSEAVSIFLFGLIPTFLITTAQIWSTFKSANKNKEAKFSLVAGLTLILIYCFVVFYILGSLQKPLQMILNLLSTKVDVVMLVIWTILIVLTPKIATLITSKITKRGSITPISKLVPNKQPKVKKNKTLILFQDKLNVNLDKWHTISGSPQINNIRGLPYPPSLLLEENPVDRRDTFITANNINIKNFKIICDIYLERGAVCNLVFRANNGFTDFYMARIDARDAGSSGILLAKNSRDWTYIMQPNSFVLNDRWYHVELTVNESHIVLKINDELIEMQDSRILSAGSVGIFNELKRVFVNNFIIENL